MSAALMERRTSDCGRPRFGRRAAAKQNGAPVSKHRLIALIVLTMFLSGCAAGRAFRRGEEAARNGDWDTAVTYYQRALQEKPEHAEYKIALERAMQNASRDHITRARELEAKDQLDAALLEWRRALELDGSNRLAASRVSELERTIRERIEQSRPRPAIESLRQQARQQATPLLNPANRDPLKVRFENSSLRDVLNFISQQTGINIQVDPQLFQDRAVTVSLENVTVEEALQTILSTNGHFYKVLNPTTIVVALDNAQGHQKYDDLVVRVFYLSHADAQEVSQVINTIMRIPQMTVQPAIFPNKTANTITVRATASVVDIIERIIRANDRPRAEVIVDVQILEVSRTRLKQYGIDLNAYAVNLIFSPEVAPPNQSATPGAPSPSPPPFNLNTISQGVSTADFYLAVPTAVLRFLEQDNRSRLLAKPQLRGQEGQKLTLNLGEEIPVVSTVFGAAVSGGFASIPQSSFNYRPVGINMEMTPRVTYDGEIVLELMIENSALGPSIDVAGQSVPSFSTRRVGTKLRLREGESNLLAGLIREEERRTLSGIIGLVNVPVINSIFGSNRRDAEQRDIVMLLTPHIVRTHELTVEDLSPIYIGTQQNIGLGGPPPLIAPVPAPDDAAAGAAAGGQVTTAPSVPGAPPAGFPRPPAAAPVGVPSTTQPTPPGTTALPTPVGPTAERPAFPPPPATPTTPPGAEPTAPPATAPVTPPAGAEPIPPVRDPTAPPDATPPAPSAATAAQVLVTAAPEMRVAGGPYTTPLSVNNASRLSTLTLTVTFNPAVLRVRNVQEGTFMRQGNATAAFTPRIDNVAGRVDIAITRTGDQSGASGTGLLAALLFDAVAPGNALIQVSGVGSNPEGGAVPLQFAPATVTVR
jgi:type II secretory pathway component GspD/PulD (secretin)